jgi:hypothetical protein
MMEKSAAFLTTYQHAGAKKLFVMLINITYTLQLFALETLAPRMNAVYQKLVPTKVFAVTQILVSAKLMILMMLPALDVQITAKNAVSMIHQLVPAPK